MLPHASASCPPARRQASIIAVTVVLPFVPGDREVRRTGQPRTELHLAPDRQTALARPPKDIGIRRHSRPRDDQGGRLEVARVVPACSDLDPERLGARRPRARRVSGRASVTRTRAPSADSARAEPVPATPAPTTTALSPANRPLNPDLLER